MLIQTPPDFYSKYTKRNKTRKILIFTYLLSALTYISIIFFPAFIVKIFSETIFNLERPFFLITLFGWLFVIFYVIYKPEKKLVKNGLNKNFHDKFPYQTLYFFDNSPFSFFKKKQASQTFLKTSNDNRENTKTIEKVYPFLKKFGDIKPYYVWAFDQSTIAVYFYVINTGKNSQTHYLSTFYSKQKQLDSNFEISKKGFLDKFKNNFEIGDEKFDNFLKIKTSSENDLLIRNDINRIGKQKILDFMKNKGIKIVANDKKLYWIKEITQNKIPKLTFKQKDYTVMPHGIEIQDDLIQRNIQKFEAFVKEQII